MHVYSPSNFWTISINVICIAIGLCAIGYAAYKWFSHYYGDELSECGWQTCVIKSDDFIYVGNISTRGAAKFVRLLLQAGSKPPGTTAALVVRVDSLGGDVGAGMAMTEALRHLSARRPVRIEVLAGGTCQSMCTVLWTAVGERVAAPSARFMFHAPRRPLSGFGRRFAEMDAETAAMRQAIGKVDPTLLAELERRGAFIAGADDVPLTAAEIAALGGAYLRLDRGLGRHQ